MDAQRQKIRVASLSILSNATLVIIKVVVGVVVGSVSVISEAIHSGVDLLASVIAFVAVKAAGKPADRQHPFGHGKAENISGTIEALLIFLAAGWIIFEAVKKLINPQDLQQPIYGVAVMLISTIVNLVVSHKLFVVGKKTDSVALLADGWHLRTDVYTSLGVMFGLFAIFIGGYLFPTVDLRWIDPCAAILVALLIIKAAYSLTVESAKDLMDISLPDNEVEFIKECITKSDSRVLGYHKLRTRKAGSDRFVEFHLLLSADLTVEVSHEITDTITDRIKEQLPDTLVIIHVEPCSGKRANECKEKPDSKENK